MNHQPVVLILGPTGGGKTDLAIDLAHQLPGGGEIIGCDSMQIYRGMDIGTAKPTTPQQARTPHHLLDIVDPDDDSFSVDHWLQSAERAIGEIGKRGKWPIIAGGTNLYVQALVFGLADVPEPNAELRTSLQALDSAELRSRLEGADPDSAARLHPNDRKRTIRAIEVFETTGRRLSAMQTQWNPQDDEKATVRSHILMIGLEYPVEAINRRINARVRVMMESGFLDEVRRLHKSQRLGRNAGQALGYKQLMEHLDGRCSLEEAVEQIKIRTRRFAKQQRNWLRRFRHLPIPSCWINAGENDAQTIANQALMWIVDQAGKAEAVAAGSPE